LLDADILRSLLGQPSRTDDGADDERGCSTLTVFMEPY